MWIKAREKTKIPRGTKSYAGCGIEVSRCNGDCGTEDDGKKRVKEMRRRPEI